MSELNILAIGYMRSRDLGLLEHYDGEGEKCFPATAIYRLLGNGIVGYGSKSDVETGWFFGRSQNKADKEYDTHSALLIGMRSLDVTKYESEERKLLREFLKEFAEYAAGPNSMIERARKLLERKD